MAAIYQDLILMTRVIDWMRWQGLQQPFWADVGRKDDGFLLLHFSDKSLLINLPVAMGFSSGGSWSDLFPTLRVTEWRLLLGQRRPEIAGQRPGMCWPDSVSQLRPGGC